MAELVTFKPRRPCPMCKRPSQPKFHPFCSDRCAQLDLGKWLNGSYAVPAAEEDRPETDNDANNDGEEKP